MANEGQDISDPPSCVRASTVHSTALRDANFGKFLTSTD